MESLSEEEKKFLTMRNSKGIKKISLNLSKESLEKIDDLKKIFKITRTLIIESILTMGLKPYIKIVESANKKLKKEHPNKNKELDRMIQRLKKFKQKWRIDTEANDNLY